MRRSLMLLVFALLASLAQGCASLQAPAQPSLSSLPFRYQGFDFKGGWKAAASPEGLRVEGLLKGIAYPRVEEVEVRVSLLSKQDQVIAQQTVFVLGAVVDNSYKEFEALLKNAAISEGDRLAFAIRYDVPGSNHTSWMTTIKVDALTGERILAKEERGFEE